MNTKVWYLSYFEGVYHTRMIATFANANARMVRMVLTMITIYMYIINVLIPFGCECIHEE